MTDYKRFIKKHPINRLCLINLSIASTFKFDDFIGYINTILLAKRTKYILLSYDEIISRFKSSDSNDTVPIRDILKSLMAFNSNPFAEIGPNGILLNKNSKQTLHSHIRDVLKQSGSPLHYTEIYKRLLRNEVNVKSDKSVLTVIFLKKQMFGLKGDGIYGLREWGGLFGNMAEVAEQILTLRNEPIHIRELENLVCKELIISKNSVKITIFKKSRKHKFAKDSQGYIRLTKWDKDKGSRGGDDVLMC